MDAPLGPDFNVCQPMSWAVRLTRGMWKDAFPVVAVMVDDDGEPVVMMSASADETLTFPAVAASKNSALRFAVGEPDCRGTVWRLFAGKKTDDVYFASRHTAGEFKVSLHQSGDWRVQLVQPDRPKTVRFKMVNRPPQGRVLLNWQRPEPDDAGWTYAASIVLPAGHLLDVPVEPWEKIQWHVAPPSGHYVEFTIHLVQPGIAGVSFGPMLARRSACNFAFMNALKLPSGEVALVLAITAPIDDAEAANLARYEELGTESQNEFPDFDSSPALGPRLLGMGSNADGEPRFYDLAYGVRTVHPLP